MTRAELIEWHDAAEDPPDADTTVLIIAGGDVEAWIGYLDGDQWRVADGMPIDTPVLYWAHLPEGPAE
ncbi:MAG TPA: hypothetical protein VJ576_02715 [Rhodocyclaceae bacterium]|nr:hypothetical protein [Rhodocyclaceae bacterium]